MTGDEWRKPKKDILDVRYITNIRTSVTISGCSLLIILYLIFNSYVHSLTFYLIL